MNIYNFNNKDMRALMKEFGKTNYGKVIYLLAYTMPMAMFIVLIFNTLIIFSCKEIEGTILFFLSFVLFLTTFILGNMYFYHELKEFAKGKK